jgi:phage-related minor tail protein
MGNMIALILVAFVIVLGIGACWAITANGAAAGTATDTFGNTPPADTIAHDGESSGLAVATMPVMLIAFFVLVCVILVAGFAWLWNTGKSKASRY